ncbi:probable 3-hydroxyisobutyrate dehydrogenase-like 2, mitochondrial [Acetobacter orientalis]|uniref:Probable 3-hydroxyisobutyrate dehydrogenase-like 2, mitochondrial n=1 Tax=Acetobacter orientalis TaxID=146474 RepID=A0A2Z5ZDX1_9PROT|nr:probable 3-hydroxyisobutyrate dehydrogenase-like 2, mitochondrial [Acetobacter orientalis]
MSHFSGMSLTEAEGLTGTQLLFWVAQANRLTEQQRKQAKTNGNSR